MGKQTVLNSNIKYTVSRKFTEYKAASKQRVLLVKLLHFRFRLTWVQILTLPLSSSVTLGKLLNFSELQVPHLYSKAISAYSIHMDAVKMKWNKIFPFLLIYLDRKKCMCLWRASSLILQSDLLVCYVGKRVYWNEVWKWAQTGLGSSPPLPLCCLCDLRYVAKVL